MKSIFIFWLLGAIDGHAKNFSIFLQSGGRFQLTPLYDVISAHPLVAKRQLEYRDLNMAMALHGNNSHYRIHEIMPRHWYSEAKQCSFPETEMAAIIDDVTRQLEDVITAVSTVLPDNFPAHISNPIFEGMRDLAGKRFQVKR